MDASRTLANHHTPYTGSAERDMVVRPVTVTEIFQSVLLDTIMVTPRITAITRQAVHHQQSEGDE